MGQLSFGTLKLGHKCTATTAPSKSVNSPASPICYWLLTIFYWLFEGKERVAPIANSR